jgi:hypothetical protein
MLEGKDFFGWAGNLEEEKGGYLRSNLVRRNAYLLMGANFWFAPMVVNLALLTHPLKQVYNGSQEWVHFGFFNKTKNLWLKFKELGH